MRAYCRWRFFYNLSWLCIVPSTTYLEYFQRAHGVCVCVRDEHLDGSCVRSLLGRVSYVLVRDVELVVGYEHGGLYFYDGVVAAVAAVVVMMADETNEEMCTDADEAMERGCGGGVNVERNETSEKIQRLRRRERDTDTQIQSQDLPP